MPLIDIRPIKTELRQKYRSLRQSMPKEIKDEKDTAIAGQVRRLWQYENNSILLVYVSTDIEVDTYRIIRQALEDGKKVAVPRCVPDTRNMEFYYIDSTDELEPGMFGVLEPIPNPERLYQEKDGGLCLVPAFSYDWQGYRLGYGKGYYDRFLSRFEGNIVGICYSDCVQRSLPHGRYDRPVELLVTEKYLRRTVRHH
ncbi:MAG: 5-formyltetrahydrofolate cyclo-ligase [Ruminococcaceae bacterium]|nr:5-formyltetrahydrofolate cyclo-ligase [Oscillospiraceae bacterium]